MKKFDYPCLLFRQNSQAPWLCVFHASASEVLEWAAVERLPDRPRASQRRFNAYKASSIKRFLTDPQNCIPTAVTIAIRPGTKVLFEPTGKLAWVPAEHGPVGRFLLELKEGIQETEKPAIVIDGQHRLYGIKQYSPTTEVTVVALLDASELEIAFQFLVINNKSSKIPTDHIRALAIEYDKDKLEARLKTAKLTQYPNLEFVSFADTDPESPFRGLLRWPSNRTGEENQIIPPAAIEGAIASIQQKEIKLFEDTDALCAFFFTVWSVVKERWNDLWTAESRLLGKIGVVCLTQYFTDALVQLADLDRIDLANMDEVRKQVIEMLDYQEKRIWTVEWVSASYDTKAGRAFVVESLIRISRNLRKGLPWYDEVKLVDPGSIGEVAESSKK